MSKLGILLLLTVLSISCAKKSTHPDYIEISGEILNANSKELVLFNLNGYRKGIAINENGVFKDTFKVSNSRHKMQFMLLEDKAISTIYVENGADIKINADAANFKETITFDSDFADNNNYYAEKDLIMQSDIGFDQKTWYRLDPPEYKIHIERLEKAVVDALVSYENLSPEFIQNEKNVIANYIKRISAKYEEAHAFSNKLAKGKHSPEFNDYENFDGSKTSLSDFSGKYVFIDVWATWCAPCKAQIPHLEELEKAYKDKNIVFVSMSVDSQKDKEKWRTMVEDKTLSGVQIIAPKQTGSEFTKKYYINAIPRFILIDPQGNIVDADAPRPSEKEKIEALLSIVN